MLLILLGVVLVFGGVAYMARQTIWRGRLSGPPPSPGRLPRDTLEPAHRGTGFLGLKANGPGLLLIAAGVILMLAGTFL